MKKFYITITNYLVKLNYIEESEYNIYLFGIQTLFEYGISIIASLIIIAILCMPFEGFIFFLVFVPLRSYLGGFHMKRYKSCFILSTLTLLCILLLIKTFTPTPLFSIILFVSSIIIIFLEANRNRIIDNETHFFQRICSMICIIIFTGIFFLVMKIFSIFFLISCTTSLVALSKLLENAITHS